MLKIKKEGKYRYKKMKIQKNAAYLVKF